MPDETLNTPDPADLTIDTTPDVAAEDFDFDQFLAGFRPNQRSVKIFDRGNLIGAMEQIADQIQDAPPDADVDDLIDEFERLKREWETGRWFTVQGRSTEARRLQRDKLIRERGIKCGPDVDGQPGEPIDPAHTIDLMCALMADQVVTPTGVTEAGLRRLYDLSEPEFSKLAIAVEFANSQMGQSSKVVGLDFSQRRSTRRPGAGS